MDVRMNVEKEIDRLRGRIAPLAKFLGAVEVTLDRPVMMASENYRGYRFSAPTVLHFCLLRGVRMVSALNASLHLARAGYTQEIGVLLRTIVEYSTQIDYVLANLTSSFQLTGDAAAFVRDFFVDSERGSTHGPGTRTNLRQRKVHDLIGERLDKLREELPEQTGRPTTELLSNVYLVLSNYVHGRYPEIMDLYGGRPGKFHLEGMRGSPKDFENVEMIDVFVTSASNCLRGIVMELRLNKLVESDDDLARWARDGC